ncbi:MAG TPA: peroxiredoxin [Rhodothermales bacterium]|nr:peroxiredoxin [Rhodothermales bacterium]
MNTQLARNLSIVLLGLAMASGVQAVQAQDVSLKIGDEAPAFQAVADNGQLWRSADHVGDKLLVVYFYPAAMTGGCTKQACAFRDDHTKLTSMGAEVVGISGDRLSNLQVFHKAHKINFPLLSDTTGAIARSFGVPVHEGGSFDTQDADGNDVTLVRDVTASRWTFIVGQDGTILYKETDVNPAKDSQTVIAAIQDLTNRG